MKLKAKLIPIAGIAATIATVAPISLTSCGQLNGGTFNLVNGYQAQYERLEQGNMTLKDMNDAYTKHLVENPMVFIDDMYWSKANFGAGFEPFIYFEYCIENLINGYGKTDAGLLRGAVRYAASNAMYDYENISVAGMQVTSYPFEVWFDGQKQYDMNIPLISCKINFDSKVKQFNLRDYSSILPIGNDVLVDGKIYGSLEFINVPFWVYPRSVVFPLYYGFDKPFQINVCSPFLEWIANYFGEYSPCTMHYDILLDINADVQTTTLSGSAVDQTRVFSFGINTNASDNNFTDSIIFNNDAARSLTLTAIQTPIYFQRIVCNDFIY